MNLAHAGDALNLGLLFAGVSAVERALEFLFIALRFGRVDAVLSGSPPTRARRLVALLLVEAATGSTLALLALGAIAGGGPAVRIAVGVLVATGLAVRRLSENESMGDLLRVLYTTQLFLIVLGPTSAQPFGLAILAATCALMYFSSGVIKIFGWRSGVDLALVLRIRWIHSYPLSQFLMKRPRLCGLTGWSVKGFEMALGLAPFVPPAYCKWFLAAGLGFHLAIALLMGIARAPLAAVIAYPAVYFVSSSFYPG